MKTLSELYLDWLNNYLTVAAFAEANDFTLKQAVEAIHAGRIEHEQNVKIG